MGELDLSVIYVLDLSRAFYCIQMNPLYNLYMGRTCSQADTDALNKNLVQYRGEAGLSQHPL